MKSRKPKDVNLKPYDMWTDEDYEAAIPEETRRAFDRAVNSPEVQELVHKMCSEKNEQYMTQEEIELLSQDLCARLPYNCQVFYEYVDDLDGKTYGYSLTLNTWCIDELVASKAVIKPYLRPMSSMTEEEYNELKKISSYYGLAPFEDIHNWTPNYNLIDWLNRKMFDFHGLIPQGLALNAKEGMYIN